MSSQQAAMSPAERWVRGVLTAFIAPAAIRVDDGDIPFALQPFLGQGAGGASSGNPLVLAGSGVGSVSFQIPNDCQIEIDDWKATSSAITSSTPAGAPLGFLVDISWNGNQNKLTPNPMPAEFVFSTSNSFQAPWSPRPWIVTWRTGNVGQPQASFSNMQFSCTNTLTTTNTIYFALMGWNRRRAGA